MDALKYFKEHNLKNFSKRAQLSQDDINHIFDWLKSEDGKKYHRQISKLNVLDAIKLSKKWTQKLIKKASIKEVLGDIKEIHLFNDNFKIVELLTQQAYLREGKLMGHCVGGYPVGRQTILSLRDEHNIPHATIEIKDQIIIQIQGRGNGPIKKEYRSYLKDFIEKYNGGINSFLSNDILVKLFGIFKDIHGDIYEINKLPNKAIVVKGYLDLSNCELTTFPNIIYNGSLILRNNQITEIPKDFKQHGVLDLSSNKIKEIPENFEQTHSLLLSNNQISEIPKNFKQKFKLDLSYNQIKEIPITLNQNRSSLNLSHNQIKEISVDFKQNGGLNLSYNQIKELPKDYEQRGPLDLSHNYIKEIPKDLKKIKNFRNDIII